MLYEKFSDSIVESIADLNGSFFVRSVTVDSIIAKMKNNDDVKIETKQTMRCEALKDSLTLTGLKRTAINKRAKSDTRRETSRALECAKKRLELDKVVLVSEQEREIYPMWDKTDPGKIKLLDGVVMKEMDMYDPMYYPNPLTDFMSNVLNRLKCLSIH